MSFEIVWMSCNHGKKKKKVKNPFTGKLIQVHDDPGMTTSERKAVTALLKRIKAKSIDDGVYSAKFRGPGTATLDLDGYNGKCQGGMISIWGLSPKLVDFIFQFAVVGNLELVPCQDKPIRIVTSVENEKRVSKRKMKGAKLIVVKSASELGAVLADGCEEWRNFNKKVTGR